jgi:hypothetical protein
MVKMFVDHLSKVKIYQRVFFQRLLNGSTLACSVYVFTALLCGSVFGVTTDPGGEPLKVIFRNGEDGYAVYRTPNLLMTTNGTLLAFSQGRVNSHHDEGVINIVLKRSFDGG